MSGWDERQPPSGDRMQPTAQAKTSNEQ